MSRASSSRLPLGQIVATPGALMAIAPIRLLHCLLRQHARCDWGLVCDEDKASNDAALEAGGRVLSAYAIELAKPAKGYGENCFWIITEADRSYTTVLLPREY
jgi:hypothetical protein